MVDNLTQAVNFEASLNLADAITLNSTEQTAIQNAFTQDIASYLSTLGSSPIQTADSAVGTVFALLLQDPTTTAGNLSGTDPFASFFGAMAGAEVNAFPLQQGGPLGIFNFSNTEQAFLNAFFQNTNMNIPQELAAAIPAIAATKQQYLANVFTAFLEAESAGDNPNGRAPGSVADLMSDWNSFTATTAMLTTAGVGSSGLPSYQAFYDQYFPDSDFQSYLNQFITNVTNKYGYFLPSQFYNLFTQQVTTLNQQQGWPAAFNSSAKVVIALQLIRLMVNFITTLQNSAIAQSKLLTFYTDWEQSYTQTANNIPTFTSNIHGPFGSNDTTHMQAQNAADQAFAQNLRDFRSIVDDNAKNIQSDINQSNQSVNQETNLITQILQEFGTIMQGLFH